MVLEGGGRASEAVACVLSAPPLPALHVADTCGALAWHLAPALEQLEDLDIVRFVVACEGLDSTVDVDAHVGRWELPAALLQGSAPASIKASVTAFLALRDTSFTLAVKVTVENKKAKQKKKKKERKKEKRKKKRKTEKKKNRTK